MKVAILVLVVLFSATGCWPQKESYTACCGTCQNLAAICTQGASTYRDADPAVAIAASKECMLSYAECRGACQP
ncbi:MAG: hypothetical protein ABFD77_00135 [Thermotogota bacterium]